VVMAPFDGLDLSPLPALGWSQQAANAAEVAAQLQTPPRPTLGEEAFVLDADLPRWRHLLAAS